MTNYVPALINDTYEIVLPDFRATFHADRPKWEKGRLESCAELMEPGMVVYDIGAEHGDFTCLYRQWVGDTGDVIPIEPAAHYWPYIRGTWEANGFSTPPQMSFVGLVDQEPRRPLPVYHDRWPSEADGEGVPDGGFVHIHGDRNTPRITIDVLAEHVRPDVVVMDIEGAELLALRGAERTLIDVKPAVYVSWHHIPADDWYHYNRDDMDAYMASMGYGVDVLPHHGEGEEFLLYLPR